MLLFWHAKQNKLEVYFSCTSAPRFLKGMRAGFLCLQDVYMPKIWIHHSAADSSWGASASIKTQGVKTYNLCFYSKIMWVIASLEAVTSRYSLEMEADFTAFRCGWGYCDPVLVPSLRTTCWLLNKTPSQENALHKKCILWCCLIYLSTKHHARLR